MMERGLEIPLVLLDQSIFCELLMGGTVNIKRLKCHIVLEIKLSVFSYQR